MSESVTVVITSKNRKGELKAALDSVRRQTMSAEVLVFDDGSTDGTSEMVRSCFPSVRCVRVEQSLGVVNARNRAIASAHGSIVLVIDDDCLFVSDRAIAQTVQDFGHPRVAAVAIPHIEVHSGTTVRNAAPSREGIFLTAAFAGGACAVRRDIFLKFGEYNGTLWRQFEEVDFCIRLLNGGYVVRCGTADPVHHLESPHRDRNIARHQVRSGMLYVWYNVPWPWMLAYILLATAKKLIQGAGNGHFFSSLSGVASGLAAVAANRAYRAPVSIATYRLFERLRGVPVPLDAIEPMLPPLAPEFNT